MAHVLERSGSGGGGGMAADHAQIARLMDGLSRSRQRTIRHAWWSGFWAGVSAVGLPGCLYFALLRWFT